MLCFIIINSACNSENEFDINNTGLRYKFIKKNSSAVKAKRGEVLNFSMKYLCNTDNENADFDSIIFEGDYSVMLKNKSHSGGSIEDALSMMHISDSAHFLISADSFYLHTLNQKCPESLKGEDLKFEIKLKKILSKKTIEEQRKAYLKDLADKEEIMREDYLIRENIEVEPTMNGLYFTEIQSGNGKSPVPNSKVTVHYKGYFLNGQEFDSSYGRNKPFSFILGRNQVIPGWEEGLLMMKEGAKAKLIIPSHLAYGDKGYEQIIPPYATLIFEIELLKVK